MKSSADTPAEKSREARKIRRYSLIGALLWTVLLSGLLVAYILEIRNTVHEIGHSMAVAFFEENVLIRRWAARHDGVYVPETADTPANSYLANISERDITTPSGKRLTLIHPAHMSRQLFEMAREHTDLPQGHITSLNPIRPENAPDAWEREALKALGQGSKEVEAQIRMNGRSYLRLMRPLLTEKPCLRCHAAQGNKEGDGRGGISVTLSLAPIQTAIKSQMLKGCFFHVFIWILGLALLWYGHTKTLRTMTLLHDERNRLHESEEQLRIIFETSESGIIMVSPLGVISFANRRMAEMLGMSLQELINTSYTEHLHESEKLLGDEKMHQLIEGEIQSVTLDRRYIRIDGTDFWGHLSGKRLENPDGSLRGLVGVISDITDRKRAEEERRQLEQQFHHAQKLESLGVLAGGIAHDFNNILTVILGYSYMAREGLDSKQEFLEAFQKVESASNRAAGLCQQMLTYAGKSEFVQTSFSLPLLVEEDIRMLQAAIKKNVIIKLDSEQDIPTIKGDESQIQQVVMNLVINAAEAIGDVNGTIKVDLTKITIIPGHGFTDAFGTIIHDGSYVCLEVSDTGCGMDEETQNRIFEPFYTTKFTGRGLGMSAIRGIVKKHYAALLLTSNPGIGTTFKVFFPVTETADYTENNSPASVMFEKTGGTVLLVDDEQTLRNMGTGLLEAMDFTALTAEHGREALEIYRERGREIDLVLLDLTMPVMGGIEAYHELRKIAPTLPIIIYSGFNIESVDEIINNDKFSGFLQKPYKPEELRRMMKRMMPQEG